MWHEIKTEQDILDFMNKVCYFHDSCVKEMKYLSGAYVGEALSMHPINDCRILKVVIQRQFDDIPMIELEFEGLKYLHLSPTDEEYTCEILDSTLLLKGDCIYWCDERISEADLDSYDGTVVCSSKLRWRAVENCMGQAEFYTTTA